jgi:hypothetical protein
MEFNIQNFLDIKNNSENDGKNRENSEEFEFEFAYQFECDSNLGPEKGFSKRKMTSKI